MQKVGNDRPIVAKKDTKSTKLMAVAEQLSAALIAALLSLLQLPIASVLVHAELTAK